jgi:hypothetical protein
VLWWTERRCTRGRVRPHVDGAGPRDVERGPGGAALALATTGGRRSVRSTEDGGGPVALLRATIGGEGRGGSGGGLSVKCQLL